MSLPDALPFSLSICEIERVRRVEAMDELKRVIDVAEDLPYARLILHMGGARETADPRKRDAAFSSLEHLILHAHHVGVTICVENTTSEMGDPGYLRDFVDEKIGRASCRERVYIAVGA